MGGGSGYTPDDMAATMTGLVASTAMIGVATKAGNSMIDMVDGMNKPKKKQRRRR